MSNSKTNVQSLISSATAAGTLSAATSSLLTGNLGAVVIAGAAGKDAVDIVASDVTLVTLLVDASSSIHDSGLEDAIREGQNVLIDALGDTREREAILMALWTFDTDVRVMHSYVGLDDVTRLDKKNYAGLGSTRLYDTWFDALTANVAYAQQLRSSGTPCKSVVVVITDGEDCGSKRRASDCAKISKDLLKSEQFTLAFVGVGGGDFRTIALDMGIPDGCIAVQAQATPSAIRQVFRMVSQSAIRASQGRIAPGPNAGFFSP
jgi:uncharacterized protein YegL